MLMQIAMLVWIFPGEGITLQEIKGMSIGTVLLLREIMASYTSHNPLG
jgi:hypothetical protein